jgi:hypothetical protein
MLAAVVSENRKLMDSTRCLLDRPTDGYIRPSGQEKLEEQSGRARRARRAKKTPDRRGPKETEVKEERTSVQADVEALVLFS